jgi:hypothetical protein
VSSQLVSVLMGVDGGVGGNGYDLISRLVNLAMSLDRCDREVCVGVAFYQYIILTSAQFVYAYFEAKRPAWRFLRPHVAVWLCLFVNSRVVWT